MGPLKGLLDKIRCRFRFASIQFSKEFSAAAEGGVSVRFINTLVIHIVYLPNENFIYNIIRVNQGEDEQGT